MGFREGNEKTSDDGQESLRLEDPAADDQETKVRLDDANDDTDDEGGDEGEKEDKAAAAAAGLKPGEQPRKKDGKWAERKAERGRERREAKISADYDQRIRRIQEDSDRRFKQMADEFDRFRQNAGGGQQRQGDPFEAKLSDVERQLEQELALIESDPNRGYKAYNQLRRQEQELITQRGIASVLAEQARNQQQRPNDPYQYRRPIIASEFPWTDDPRYDELSRKAAAYREYLIKVEGKPDTIDTDREALTTSMARFGGDFGLRPPPAAPSQRTRNLWQAPASRGMADRRAPPREVDLGDLGRGHGLSAKALAAAVNSAINDEN